MLFLQVLELTDPPFCTIPLTIEFLSGLEDL